jgi:hypothetical protein
VPALGFVAWRKPGSRQGRLENESQTIRSSGNPIHDRIGGV